MTNTQTQTDSFGVTVAKSLVLFVRVLQVALATVGTILVAGIIMGDGSAISMAAVGVFTLVLYGLVGMLELLAVNPLRRWST